MLYRAAFILSCRHCVRVVFPATKQAPVKMLGDKVLGMREKTHSANTWQSGIVPLNLMEEMMKCIILSFPSVQQGAKNLWGLSLLFTLSLMPYKSYISCDAFKYI